jgi:multidrug efflux pump subunit AcrB
VMAQQISTVSGVSQVQVFGGQKYAVRIQLDPDALAGRGIGVDEVQAAIGPTTATYPPASSTVPSRPSPSSPRASSPVRPNSAA